MFEYSNRAFMLLDPMSMESKHAKLKQLQTRFAAMTCLNHKNVRMQQKLGQSMSEDMRDTDNVLCCGRETNDIKRW